MAEEPTQEPTQEEKEFIEQQEAQNYQEPINQALAGLINQVANVPFTIEHLQNAYLLRTSPYQAQLISSIHGAPLSLKAKKAMVRLVYGYFDQTVFLANLSPNKTGFAGRFMGNLDTEKAEIILNLIMIELRLSFDVLDINKPELINILGMLKSHIQFILTRTVGDKREGVVQHETPIKIETESTWGKRTVDKPNQSRWRWWSN